MLLLEEGIDAHLKADVSVTALAGARGFPLAAPVDAPLPAWIYRRKPGTQRDMAHDGPTGFVSAPVQIECTGATYSDAKRLADAIRRSLNGFTGVMGGQGGVQVYRCEVSNDTDAYNQETGTYTVSLDISFCYKEMTQ